MDNYQVNFPVMLGLVIDAAKNNLSSTAIDTTLELPAGFVATGVVFEEMVKAGSSVNITLKAKTANITLGKVTAVGSTNKAKAYYGAVETAIKDASTTPVETTVPSAKIFAAGDIVTIASSANLTSGKFRIGIVGFRAIGGDITTEDNKAPVDPYTPPEKQ